MDIFEEFEEDTLLFPEDGWVYREWVEKNTTWEERREEERKREEAHREKHRVW